MAGETAVETPVQDNKIDEPVKTDKEAIVEEEKEAQQKEEKKDEEKKETEKAPKKEQVEKPKKLPVHKQDFEKDVVYLYQSNRRTPVIPSTEAACLKVESWLKLNGIKYENVDHRMKLRSKRGTMPFVELNGEEISDSNHIIEVLSKKFDVKVMPMEITAEQKQVQHAMCSMVENHFNWSVVHWKCKDLDPLTKGYKMDLAAAIGYKLPAALLNFYFKNTYLKKGQKKVKSQGLGTSDEEMDNMGKEDMKVLSDTLGDKEFMFGGEPSFLDLIVYAHMAPVAFVDKECACALRDYMESDCQNLVGLVNRMKDRCWGDDWAKATGEEMDLNPHIPKPVPEEPAKEEETKKEEGEKEAKKEEGEKETKKEEKKEEEKETAEEKKEEKEE